MGTPKTPYREGKPLAEIIPPDHRRLKLAGLVVGSMIAGVVLWVVGGSMVNGLRAAPMHTGPTEGYVAGRILPSTLRGPDHDVAMPPPTLSIIHVWLQGCQDCMPAFEAMRRLEDEGGLGVDAPIYNVSYDEADPTWASRYGVRTNLAYDEGGAHLVRPLGIGTFTTLVVDKTGTILLRDRPDRPGYRARVRAAVHAEDPRGQSTSQALDASMIETTIAAHRRDIKYVCFDRLARAAGTTSQSATIVVRIEPGGNVSSAMASATTDVTFGKCMESQVRQWQFPSAERASTVTIPFRFVQQ